MVVNLGPQSHTAWQPSVVARDKETRLFQSTGAHPRELVCAQEKGHFAPCSTEETSAPAGKWYFFPLHCQFDFQI